MIDNDFNEKYRNVVARWAVERQVEVIDQSAADEVQVVIKPKIDQACPLYIASKNRSTQIHVGRNIMVDEVDGLYANDGSVLTSVLSEPQFILLLDAVLAGNVREQIKLRRGVVISSNGCVTVGGKAYCVQYRKLAGMFMKPDEVLDITYGQSSTDGAA